METGKKKRVAKVIVQNVLVWISTLCLVLCAIPLHSEAAEEGYVDCTVTITKDGAAWSDPSVVMKKVGSEETTVSLTVGEAGTYAGELEKDAQYNLYIGDKLREENISSSEAISRTFNYHTVRFLDSDGSDSLSVAPQVVIWGVDLLTQPEAPSKEGVTFKQWVTEQGGEVPFEFQSPVSADTTAVYASWEAAEIDEPDEHQHIMSGEEQLKYDEIGHWQYCTAEDCPDQWDTSENLSEESKEQYFTAHDMVQESEQAASCEEAGQEVEKCRCGYEKTIEIPALGHKIPQDEEGNLICESDETGHTYVCEVCGGSIQEDHKRDEGQITKPPTEEESGIRIYSCEICGYVIETEEVPYDPEHEHEWNEGKITEVPTTQSAGKKIYTCTVCGDTKEEEIPQIEEGNIIPPATYVSSSSVPTMSLITRRVDMMDNLLTPEEKERVANGESVQFVLEISDEAADIPAEDKAAIEGHLAGSKSLSGYHVAQYIDIDLFKVIGDDDPIQITDTGAPVTIVIEVPNVLMNAGRSFAVLWVHEGNPNYVLDADKDERTITLNTSMFSTYAIAYDGAVIGNGDDNSDDDNSGTGTGDGTDKNDDDQSSNAGDSTNTGNNGANGQNTDNSSNNANNSTNAPAGNNTGTGNGNTGNQNNSSGTGGKSTGSSASPKTADSSPILLYVTIAMISAMAYMILLLTDKERRMTEQEKDALIDALTRWAREQGASAKLFMGFAVLCVLLYYHTIGKRVKAVSRERI